MCSTLYKLQETFCAYKRVVILSPVPHMHILTQYYPKFGCVLFENKVRHDNFLYSCMVWRI